MSRLPLVQLNDIEDPEILGILAWVIEIEGKVPNHFAIEMNFPELMKSKLGFTKVLGETRELSMDEIQHVGILISKANNCRYCTTAFCTILVHGLGGDKSYAQQLVTTGSVPITDHRLLATVDFAGKVNEDASKVNDDDIETLKRHGLTNKGVIQLIHLVSDFASYNRLNLALDTDYDYACFGNI